jgi:hypothetical protein
MNEEKQEDRFHNESIKVRFCPIVVPNRNADYKAMTYGETYTVLEKLDTPSGASRYLVTNDYGNKVWINEDHFEPAKEPTLRCEKLYEEDDLESLSAAMKDAATKPFDLDVLSPALEEANILSGIEEKKESYSRPCWAASPVDRKIFSDVHAEEAILDNLDEVWESIHKVFPDLAEEAGCLSVRTKDVYELMHDRMGFDFTTEGCFLCVNGMTTKITTESIDTAFRGLKAIVGEKRANKVVASVICKKLESIF